MIVTRQIVIQTRFLVWDDNGDLVPQSDGQGRVTEFQEVHLSARATKEDFERVLAKIEEIQFGMETQLKVQEESKPQENTDEPTA